MFFKTKHNQIYLYQQLSSRDNTFCVGGLGVHPMENIYGNNRSDSVVL